MMTLDPACRLSPKRSIGVCSLLGRKYGELDDEGSGASLCEKEVSCVLENVILV